MKNITFTSFVVGLFILASGRSWGGEIGRASDVTPSASVVIDRPCSIATLVSAQASGSTVGDATVAALDQGGVTYSGDRSGLASIAQTPVGLEAVEFVSDERLRVYGWCYEVNGVQPPVMPDKFLLIGGENIHIHWFFGYAESIRNEWVSYCVPSSAETKAELCGPVRGSPN